MSEPKKFTIERSTWRAGKYGDYQVGAGRTELLNDQGYMCCLGQVLLQSGLAEHQIKNKETPYGTRIENFLCTGINNTRLAIDAMEINDDKNLTTPQREQRLIELFKQHGYTLEFIGTYAGETV